MEPVSTPAKQLEAIAPEPEGNMRSIARIGRREPRREERGHRILACLDRSPFSEVALPHALTLAQTFASALTLVHVMQPAQEARPRGTDAIGWEIGRQEARAYLERMQKAAEVTLGRAIESRLEEGRPAERIIQLGRELNADIIVIGSHGEGGISACNLGSTAQQIVAVARGSVFVAHPAAPEGPSPAHLASPKLILVPLDGSLRTESALPTAARLAARTGAELLLVHVVDEPVANSVLSSGEDLELARRLASHLEAGAHRYLSRLCEQLIHEVQPVRTMVVRHVSSRQAILDLVAKESVDLIVLSAHGSACDPSRSFGGVAVDLLTRSTVPLLVLQDLPPQELQGKGEGSEGQAAPQRARRAAEGV